MKSSNSTREHHIQLTPVGGKVIISSNGVTLGELVVLTAFHDDRPTDAFYLTLSPQSGKLHTNNAIYHNPED